MLVKEFEIKSHQGLHARPASVMVAEASKFKSDITIKYNDREISAKSMIAVLSLGVKQNSVVTVTVTGEDEEQAMARFEILFNEEMEKL